MLLRPPDETVEVLASFDTNPGVYYTHDVEHAIANSIANVETLTPEAQQGFRAELWAFAVRRRTSGQGHWKTYFQPFAVFATENRGQVCMPDLAAIDAAILQYWRDRADAAIHPTLKARYADLAWDMAKIAANGKPEIGHARIAIDSYIEAARRDTGEVWGETREQLGRALELSMRLDDTGRIQTAISANIDYVNRTMKDELIGTYSYLFERLLPSEKRPPLSVAQETELVTRFEEKFAAMIAPDSPWDVNPHAPQGVGKLLAGYYQRKGDNAARVRVLRGIASLFERKARLGDALLAIIFLEDARKIYLEAGLRDDAERVQREGQSLGPEAEKCMIPIAASTEIKDEDIRRFQDGMVAGGLDAAMTRFAQQFVPRQAEIVKFLQQRDDEFFSHFLMPVSKMAHGHIVARINDDASDPDGTLVHETASYLKFSSPFISWTLDRMVQEGFSATAAIGYLDCTPIFEAERLPLIRRGIQAHLDGNFAESIHILLPQIEHALRMLCYLSGQPSNKQHRTGRGEMQFKNMNDILLKEVWPVRSDFGEDLRMYLLASLAHPKGANIRNEVAHGLWPEVMFTKEISERVLHLVFAVGLIRPQPPQQGDLGEAATPPDA